ncbi:hypothetical protein RFI_12108 [Reticulomyxa filosa]|uniref:Uncharacterized protein n=1 Tax=Reticulomyxa filosa TaxID=46433 RepID=X6NGB7_RETFI|nr:hypothetical protein RFI_12108 [Reticulomyxa filosa]|eukprot:ETO25036.1 hypothetical protein RFI_12108 [Reticulomyxa filosa]
MSNGRVEDFGDGSLIAGLYHYLDHSSFWKSLEEKIGASRKLLFLIFILTCVFLFSLQASKTFVMFRVIHCCVSRPTTKKSKYIKKNKQ